MTPPTPIPSHDREPWMQPAIEAFEKIEVPARPDDRGTIERLLMTEMSDRTVPSRLRIGSFLNETTTRRAIFALAAVILLALVLTAVLMPTFSPQEAFAQMVENVQEARTAVMDTIVTSGPTTLFAAKTYLKNPGHMRQEMQSYPTTNIYDFVNRKMLILMPPEKRASLADLSTGEQRTPEQMDLVAGFRDLPAGQAKLVEELVEGGQKLLVYDVAQENLTRRFWVKKQTLLPVRMQMEMTLPGSKEPTRMVWDHMRWDVPLDDALFSMTPPADYQLSSPTLGAAGPADLTKVLRLWTTLSGGPFPDEFHPMSMYQFAELFAQYHQRIRAKGIDPVKAHAELAQAVGSNSTKPEDPAFRGELQAVIGRGATYLAVLVKRNDWHWTGKGARFGDAERIICFWKNDDGNGYRGLDGNLKLRPLSPEQLPTTAPTTMPRQAPKDRSTKNP